MEFCPYKKQIVRGEFIRNIFISGPVEFVTESFFHKNAGGPFIDFVLITKKRYSIGLWPPIGSAFLYGEQLWSHELSDSFRKEKRLKDGKLTKFDTIYQGGTSLFWGYRDFQ